MISRTLISAFCAGLCNLPAVTAPPTATLSAFDRYGPVVEDRIRSDSSTANFLRVYGRLLRAHSRPEASDEAPGMERWIGELIRLQRTWRKQQIRPIREFETCYIRRYEEN